MAITFTVRYPGDNDIVEQGGAQIVRHPDGMATYRLPEGSKEFKRGLPSWCGIPVRALYVLPQGLAWMVRDDDGPQHQDHLQKVGSRYEAPEIRDFLSSQGI